MRRKHEQNVMTTIRKQRQTKEKDDVGLFYNLGLSFVALLKKPADMAGRVLPLRTIV